MSDLHQQFPVRDGAGNLSLPMLRDAIKAIPAAQGFDDATKKQLQQKARRLLVEASTAAGSKALSLYDITNRIGDAVRAASPAAQARALEGRDDYPEYWYVKDIYPGYVIVETRSGNFKAAYSMDGETGAVSIAGRESWKLVKQEWVEVSA